MKVTAGNIVRARDQRASVFISSAHGRIAGKSLRALADPLAEELCSNWHPRTRSTAAGEHRSASAVCPFAGGLCCGLDNFLKLGHWRTRLRGKLPALNTV